ncbi:S1C family serine protease [Oceaniferula marina]|nr:trypsin-like peptidase domain-containing protein [Oceaniferula marina]
MKTRERYRNGSGRCRLAVAVLLLMGSFWLHAQNVLPADIRINGKVMWEAFESQRQVLQQSSAVVYTDGKSHVKSVYGVVVSADGYVLTKASEIEGKKSISMRIGRDLYTNVEVVNVDPRWDVAMLKVAADHPLVPVDLSEDDDVVQGHWVVSNGSASRSTRRVRVGVVSAMTREIKSSASDVILGVMLSADDALKVEKVTPKSGAEKAGLKPGDVLKRSGDVELKERADLLKSMKGKKPGDTLEIELLREKKTMLLEVELMARPGKQMMSRNDQMSGGEDSLSKRRDGFPRVIHHDTPLIKSSVGGPLLDLNGLCIGMNIARASRVATFAIPARELRGIIENMIP